MSSNRTIDPNDLYRLLSQYQQHASSSAQRFQTVSGVLPAPAAVAPTPPAVMQLLASLVAGHQQQSLGGGPDTNSTGGSGNSAHGPSAFQAQMRPQYQLDIRRPSSAPNVNGGDMGQQILASAQLLSALNPDLAATAIANAFNLNPQQPVHQQPPQQQQQQQRQPNSILESLCQHLQHHTNIPSSSPTTAKLNLCFQSESATMAPASSAKILDVNQMHATPSDIGTPDTRNTIKNTTALPISLHCLDQNIPSQVAAASCSNACPPSNLLAKNWTLEQLEAYAKQLQDSHQPIPQSIAILLASARRREEKHNAKKLANRKSAFSSRIRKKARIDAMAEENVRLKREANILSFLPDPVLAIGIGGEITFCSTQMERVSQHKASDLIGENVEKVIAPATWGELQRMIKHVVTARDEDVHPKEEDIARVTNATKEDGLNEGNSWGYSTRGNHSAVSMESSEHSFPMNEVAVDSSGKVSDPSGYYLKKAPSKEFVTQAFSVNNNYRKTHIEDEDILKTSTKMSHQDYGLQSRLNHKRVLETSRSLSSLTEREGYKSSLSTDSSLSKTKGRPSESNLSEDSGYIELHNSQESNKSSSYSCGDTDEDGANPPNEVNRTPPLAPACIVCLIRDDLSTLWCEVTSSIHTVHISNGDCDPAMLGRKHGAPKERQKSSDDTSSFKKGTATSEKPEVEMKELLLCFRPILEGSKVDLGLRKKVVSKSPEESYGPRLSEADKRHNSAWSCSLKKRRLPKKRQFTTDEEFQNGQ
ncbi:hypothetical protein HJC23_000501 [Cyclotella cryptica]|uniref:PAS domain-containing protein n=1 Tax=Cyclotella cryptica TaxID=29204 RepID=A0ABD3NWP2_9STRA|eukprot:CCRYP_019679-RA/>CCRYP_019679-RA protein AED:0.04 eAED:0.04 QI:697/1/1/1/0.8/0.66/6/390/759